MLSLWVLLFYYDYLNFSVSTTWLNFQSENHLHMCLVCNNKIWYLFFFLIYEDFYDPVEEDEFEQDVKVHILFPTESLLVSSQLYLIYIWVLLHDAWIFYTLKKQSSIRFGITWHTIYIYNENIFTLDEFLHPWKKQRSIKFSFIFHTIYVMKSYLPYSFVCSDELKRVKKSLELRPSIYIDGWRV